MFAPTRRIAAGILAAGVLLAGAGCSGKSDKNGGLPGGAGPAPSGSASAGGGQAAQDVAAIFNSAVGGFQAGGAGQKVTIHLDGTPDDLVSLAKAGDSSSSLTSQQAGLILGSSVAVSGKDGAFAFVVNVDNTKVLDLRSDGKALYFKVDAKKIADLAGQDLTKAQALVGQLPGAAQQYATDLLNGKFLKIDLGQVKDLVKRFAPSAQASASAAAGQASQALDAVKTVLAKDLTATSAGEDPALGTHEILSGNLRTLATDLNAEFAKIPGASLAGSSFKPSDVPDKDVKIDVYGKDNKLTRVSVDLIQFVPEAQASAVAGKKLALVVDFSDQLDDTSAPPDATAVDIPALLATFGSAFGGGGSSSTP